jgi:hypothetical protein
VIFCISALTICVPYAVGMFLLALLMLDKTGKQLNQAAGYCSIEPEWNTINNKDELFMNETKLLNTLTYNGTQFNNTLELLN